MGTRIGAGLKVLVVDDDESIRLMLNELLSDEGFTIDLADCMTAGLARLEAGSFDLVMTDKNLGDGSGLEIAQRVIDSVKAGECDTDVIIMSAFANLESAVEAIRMRVADYLVKPFDDIENVIARVQRVVERAHLKKQNRQLLEELTDKNKSLEQMVVRDGLTGLFNHAYFQERLENEIHRSERHQHECGLVFIDIDRFKSINDGLGHQVGDDVLRKIAEVLRGKSRASDAAFRMREHDIAARYGGDEFVLILPETPRIGAAVKADRLRKFIGEMEFDGVDTPITLSVGVATYPSDGKDRPSLVRAADTALYASKRLGRNRVMSYTSDLDPPGVQVEGRVAGGSEKQLLALERSIAGQKLDFVYQPIVDAHTWRIYGYEALCRPSDAAFSNVLELITTAERAGKVADLGRVMRANAMRPIEELDETFLLFINLHPHELHDSSLVQADEMKRSWNSRVVLEVPERAARTDLSRTRRTVEQLRVLGFKIALADLEGSYASLDALVQLEVDFVKLPRRLVALAESDARASRYLQHVFTVAHEEKILAIAEGVETQEQCDATRQLGSPLMQGYLFGKGEPPFAEALIPERLADKAARGKKG